jgi:hypothetical protein
MIQKIAEPISVIFSSRPLSLHWSARDYRVSQIGLHHTFRDGRILHHIYSVAGDLFLLNLDTETLHWTLFYRL